MASYHTVEIPVQGMDCTECTRHVQAAIAALPGVRAVDVRLATEKAIVSLDPEQVALTSIAQAVAAAGYTATLPNEQVKTPATSRVQASAMMRSVLTLLGIVVGLVLFVVVIGEWLGLFATLTDWIPWPVGALLTVLVGYPIFRNVLRATLRGKIIAHSLMSLGAIAALVVGQWTTAVIVVFFMRVGDYVERMTTERARQSVKSLAARMPLTARVERDGLDTEVPLAMVQRGEIVVVRPGEQIPVDGEVLSGTATIDQSMITGESMPIDVVTGSRVYATTIAQMGSLRIRATHVGADALFGQMITLVEEAEAKRADVQRIADTFAAYYLPVVVVIAVLTFLWRRDPLATTAVLVVACSCSFTLATPIAMLASIGAAAKRGLLIKGSKYLETLARADVVLVDKTGTLTLGKPQITDVLPLDGGTARDLLQLVATAERYSEHPLAEAVRNAAQQQGISLGTPEQFQALPGKGIHAQVKGTQLLIGNRQLLTDVPAAVAQLEEQGKTLLVVLQDDRLIGVLAASDTIRPEIPEALARLRALGIQQIEVLTGDTSQSAAAIGNQLAVAYRANLLPTDKIAIVKTYQQQGHTVMMVGDGVNDAPALAQADVGIAMGVMGSDLAVEAAHVLLLQNDWRLVPEVLHIAQRTLRVVKGNFAFTVLYNLIGLSLAATGILPPILAAAAQSLPDLGILANSSRLLRVKKAA